MASKIHGENAILHDIGSTPHIPLKNIDVGNLSLWAKLEWKNPFGSVKDRPAYRMIHEAEKAGFLKKGDKIVIEPTSGNTGIALAGIAKILGFGFEAVIPERVSEETKEILKGTGAKVLETEDDLCPKVGGRDQAIALAQAIVKGRPDTYYMPNQYENEANFLSHYETTGPEVWRDTNGKITHFVTGIGTGGTVTGAGKYLKERKPDIRIIAVQPQKNHHIQGLRNLEESQMPALLEKRANLVDEWVTIRDQEAFDAVKELAKKEGLFVGPSSGAVLAAAGKISVKENGQAVLVFADSGTKYKSVYKEFNIFTSQELEQLERNAKWV